VALSSTISMRSSTRRASRWPHGKQGKLTWREKIIEGIERAPEAFIGLFSGDSFGRRLVHVT